MPAVSVIVPVYNVESYIARCARSLFSQTLKDIEFLFIDDCSPDRSIEIMREVLEEFPERKEQVTVYRMPQNSGQAKVRMCGLTQASGDYIIQCDSDDYVDTDAYELMYNKAKSEDLDIVTCDIAVERGREHVKIIHGECTSVATMLIEKSCWSLTCRMIRFSLFDGIIPPVDNVGEDMVISIQTLLKARNTGHIDSALYHYCLRDNSITLTPGNEAIFARWSSFIKNATIIEDILKTNYGYSGNEPEMIKYKYNSRVLLRPLVHIPSYYKCWKATFPEVDKRVLFASTISLEEKFWFVLIHLRLYHPVKCITGWIKNRD